jgi:hypothetical protein
MTKVTADTSRYRRGAPGSESMLFKEGNAAVTFGWKNEAVRVYTKV